MNGSNEARIDGSTLYGMLRSAFASLSYNESYLNDINTFPVSDSDTGTNMKRTFRTGLLALQGNEAPGEMLSRFAKEMTRKSRGNSGFILSQYFLGLSDSLKEKEAISIEDLSQAISHAYHVAYAAVINPMEGTMLTVMREGSKRALARFADIGTGGLRDFFALLSADTFQSVLETHGQMRLLERNNVVDSGALGFYLVIDGMKKWLEGDTFYFDCKGNGLLPKKMAEAQNPLSFFRYCTEFTIRLKERRGKDYFTRLLSSRGDSVVVAINDGLLKVHIHTNAPQTVIQQFGRFGEIVLTKVDDLFDTPEFARLKTRKREDYAVVAFTNGTGNAALFENLGADAAFPVPESHEPTEEELKNILGPFLEGNLVVYSANKKIEDALKSMKWWDHRENLLVVECRGLANAFFKLASSMFDGPFREFSRQLDMLKRIKTLELSFRDMKDIREHMESALSPERLSGRSSLVFFGGKEMSQEAIDAITFHFASRDDIEFNYFPGGQESPLLVVGVM